MGEFGVLISIEKVLCRLKIYPLSQELRIKYICCSREIFLQHFTSVTMNFPRLLQRLVLE